MGGGGGGLKPPDFLANIIWGVVMQKWHGSAKILRMQSSAPPLLKSYLHPCSLVPTRAFCMRKIPGIRHSGNDSRI